MTREKAVTPATLPDVEALATFFQRFTSSGTLVKDSAWTWVLAEIIGGGGDGANASNTVRAGGGGGTLVRKLWRASDLPNSISATVGSRGGYSEANGIRAAAGHDGQSTTSTDDAYHAASRRNSYSLGGSNLSGGSGIGYLGQPGLGQSVETLEGADGADNAEGTGAGGGGSTIGPAGDGGIPGGGGGSGRTGADRARGAG